MQYVWRSEPVEIQERKLRLDYARFTLGGREYFLDMLGFTTLRIGTWNYKDTGPFDTIIEFPVKAFPKTMLRFVVAFYVLDRRTVKVVITETTTDTTFTKDVPWNLLCG